MTTKENVGFEIRSVSNLIKRRFGSSEVKQMTDKMTGTHGWVIGWLYENRNKDIFQRDLENLFSIRRPTATAILQLMEKNGLITRSSVDYDARLKKLELTRKAIDLHKLVNSDIQRLEKDITRGISDDELSAFLATLKKIKSNLENEQIGKGKEL